MGTHENISLLEEFQWVPVLLQGLCNCFSCIMFQWNNSKNLRIWGWNLKFEIISLKAFYHEKHSVLVWAQKLIKEIPELRKFWCRSILSQDV